MAETVPGWSDERVDLLRRLWEDGLSASQIATQLGGVTRNAVIGKVHRLGLSGRVKSGETSGASPRKTVREAELEVVAPALAVAEPDTAPVAFEAPVAAPAVVAPVSLTISRRVTIMDLRESMCRWPIGDPTSPDFHYCGDRSITGLPYCTTHAQIAYQPAAERKRDRRVGGFR
ncbi:GcrA cell cycle regulator [Methylobacterium sp. Leaf104]|uniref:GcrA family cell cycle regulator n=1 Tax=Methylobacterium TaxID=407 RepID=UPI0006FD0721|nr:MULTISPECIES: GcrA family cell cycle regulator [Methylobacterium]KQP30882.1 GcrA cell cycle regulator [Methylobacterium sp. Leaf104]MCI9879253.1 GcrA cell cycle regulator [Methylobacterium goesingense]